MSKNPAKDFGPIAADYAFFEAHATEMEQDARAYAECLAGTPAEGAIRMLDFGCGTGTLTARLLGLTGWAPARLRLTLVEPVEAARRQAVARLAGRTEHPVVDSAALPEGTAGGFEVVLANHVLYYVPDLPDRLAALIGAVAPSGAFVTAISPRTNALIAVWIAGFRMLNREVPYNTSEDVEATLRALGAEYRKREVTFELTFPDTEENRTRIVRFLLADHLEQLPLRPLLDLFDPHSRSGRIDIRTVSDHFTVRPK